MVLLSLLGLTALLQRERKVKKTNQGQDGNMGQRDVPPNGHQSVDHHRGHRTLNFSLLQRNPKPHRWLLYMRGLKPDLALRENALLQQQRERWAPYLYVRADWEKLAKKLGTITAELRPDWEELLKNWGITVERAAERKGPAKARREIGLHVCANLFGRGAENMENYYSLFSIRNKFSIETIGLLISHSHTTL